VAGRLSVQQVCAGGTVRLRLCLRHFDVLAGGLVSVLMLTFIAKVSIVLYQIAEQCPSTVLLTCSIL